MCIRDRDLYIADEKDRDMEEELKKLSVPYLFTDTIMSDRDVKRRLAQTVIEGLKACPKRTGY